MFMADNLTTNVTTFILILMFIGMIVFVAIRAKQNRENMIETHAPKVAGEDELEGGARNPQRFDEPDEEALEEMAELLGEDSEDEA
jgi:hypothetical protein